MWKFQDFCVIQILREINFGESRSCESAIFCHFRDFEVWILLIRQISAFKMCQNSLKSKYRASKCVRIADFVLLESQKLISRKIWVREKSWNFNTVQISIRKWHTFWRTTYHVWEIWWSYCQDIRKKGPFFICYDNPWIYTPKQKPGRKDHF